MDAAGHCRIGAIVGERLGDYSARGLDGILSGWSERSFLFMSIKRQSDRNHPLALVKNPRRWKPNCYYRCFRFPPSAFSSQLSASRECLHLWCEPRSSKPVAGVNNARSRFDADSSPFASSRGGHRRFSNMDDIPAHYLAVWKSFFQFRTYVI